MKSCRIGGKAPQTQHRYMTKICGRQYYLPHILIPWSVYIACYYIYIYIYIYMYIYIINPNRTFLLGMSGYSLVFRFRLLGVFNLSWQPHLFITLSQECRSEWHLNVHVWCTGYYRADSCWLFYLVSHSSSVIQTIRHTAVYFKIRLMV